MKAISFLGRSDYESVTYVYGEQECTTHLFPHAVARFFTLDELLVCLTPEAKTFVPKKHNTNNTQTHFERLCTLHQQDGLVQPSIVDIPNGASQAELWEIFMILTRHLNAGDEVVFDITYAFRSLPLLAFLAAAYLRVAKQITLRAIMYGAFEAKDIASRTPVFDLTPFLSLLDWTTATEQFLQTGNAQVLARLLMGSTPQAQPLAASLEGIAQGLQLLRPLDVMRRAAEVPERIASVIPTMARMLPPSIALLERVHKDYGRFGVHDPSTPSQVGSRLLRQLDLAEWYFEKNQIVHALSMAREWLPSLLCYHFHLKDLDRENRQAMESLLNNEPSVTVQNQACRWSEVGRYGLKLRALWGRPMRLATLRNDVLHAGLNKQPQAPKQIIVQTRAILTELGTLARLWKLEGPRI